MTISQTGKWIVTVIVFVVSIIIGIVRARRRQHEKSADFDF